MSYEAQVIADSSGEWVGNQLRFETFQEAESYVSDLSYRWTSVRNTRVVPSDDPVTTKWKDGRTVSVVELVKIS